MFEFYSLSVSYDVSINTYFLDDMNYHINLGSIVLEEGPGWIWLSSSTEHTPFLDSGMATALAELLNTLNAELS